MPEPLGFAWQNSWFFSQQNESL